MLDIGWTEIMVIALVLIIVVGPKDLPRVLRTVGKWTAKAKSLSREFQRSIDDLAREADVADMKKELNSISGDGIKKNLENQIDPDGEMAKAAAEDFAPPDIPLADGSLGDDSPVGDLKGAVAPANDSTGDEEVLAEPVLVANTKVEPAASEPATSEPAASEPATSEPATSEPATSEPATSEPATSEPAHQ